jgi:hypothetical protein
LIGDDVVGLESRTVDVRHGHNMDQNGQKESLTESSHGC